MPSSPTTLFYDLETTGLSPAFDQILQFAAVRLDSHFNEIERYNFRITLSEDVIPSPKALLVNRIHPNDFSQGLNEYEAIKYIYNIINEPDTISMGYNTLTFDEEFLRFSFFRHLLPSYTHQYANDCHRMDLYPMILLAYHLRRDLLQWPEVNGKISFKLEHLVRANNLSSGQSHDALVDVLDTIAVAKKLKSDFEFWEQAVSFFDKKNDARLLENCQTRVNLAEKWYAHGFMIGSQPSAPILPVLYLGEAHKNHTRWLRLDDVAFDHCSPDTLCQKISFIRKKYGEPPFFFAADDMRCNASLHDERRALVDNNLKFLFHHPQIFSGLQCFVLDKQYNDHPNFDANAALYKLPFPTPNHESLFRKFRLIENERKLEVALMFQSQAAKEKDSGKQLACYTYYVLAIRLLGRHFHDVLTDCEKTDYQQYLSCVLTMDAQQAMTDQTGKKKLTLPEAIAETQNLLREKTDADSQRLLLPLLQWYHNKNPVLTRQQASHPVMGLFSRANSTNGEQVVENPAQLFAANR